MDAACGESRQGRRVSPCPLKLMLFREAAGHPVSRKVFFRLSDGSAFCRRSPGRAGVTLYIKERFGVAVQGGGEIFGRTVAQLGHGLQVFYYESRLVELATVTGARLIGRIRLN